MVSWGSRAFLFSFGSVRRDSPHLRSLMASLFSSLNFSQLHFSPSSYTSSLYPFTTCEGEGCTSVMAQVGAPDDLLNSSDQEYEVAFKPHFRAGLKSIESMHKSRNEDRFTSKKRLRELDDVRGAPGTIYHRELWVNRLENYAQSINLV